MKTYIDIFLYSFTGYWDYLLNEITSLYWDNYFYWLIGISLTVWAIELITPWRKEQASIRQDFGLDLFYMFFNFFLFSLIGFNAASNIGVTLFNDGLSVLGIENIVALNVHQLPRWAQLGIMFLLTDFIQWNIHRLLHRFPVLWEFHKIHHSVGQMGFAAHLRFHWMESVFYKTIQFIPLTMIGFGINDFFIIHLIEIVIGHLNHANIGWDYGPFKYLLNNPKMHIWHHAKQLPKEREAGVNFGLSLSIWDYIFKTNYVPSDGKDIPLGFEGVNKFPKTFIKQSLSPFKKKHV